MAFQMNPCGQRMVATDFAHLKEMDLRPNETIVRLMYITRCGRLMIKSLGHYLGCGDTFVSVIDLDPTVDMTTCHNTDTFCFLEILTESEVGELGKSCLSMFSDQLLKLRRVLRQG